METKEDLKNMILDAWKDGYVVFASIEGLYKQTPLTCKTVR